MKWGDAQAVVQLIVGANLAYYAFKDMRMGHTAEYLKSVEELSAAMRKGDENIELIKNYRKKNRNDFSGLHDVRMKISKLDMRLMNLRGESFPTIKVYGGREISRIFEIPAIIVSVFGFSALVISSILYNKQIARWVFDLIVFFGSLPILANILAAYLLSRVVRNKWGKEYREIHAEYYEVTRSVIDYEELVCAMVDKMSGE